MFAGPAAVIAASNQANELIQVYCARPTLKPCPSCPRSRSPRAALSAALDGAEVESALAPGMVALKSVDPPLEAIVGRRVSGVRRVGKMPVVEFETAGDGTVRSRCWST